MLSSALFLPSATWFSWSFALGTLHPAGAEDQVIRNALFNDLVTLEPPSGRRVGHGPFALQIQRFPVKGIDRAQRDVSRHLLPKHIRKISNDQQPYYERYTFSTYLDTT